jgi:NADP-dependent 3-hydroxy acid dehydrogenase YdfG
MKQKIEDDLGAMAMPAEAIARAILFAIEQPPEVDVGSIVIRPTVQG